MAESLWTRPPGCVCSAEVVEPVSGSLEVVRVASDVCPLHSVSAAQVEAVMGRVLEAGRTIPGMKDLDPARLRRLIRTSLPVVRSILEIPPDSPTEPPAPTTTGQE